MKPESQLSQILNHLQDGRSLTPVQALIAYGCFRLAARVQNLRDKGHNIETKMIEKDGKYFARYRMVI